MSLATATAMLHRTPLYIVCSPRPRAGRTLLARLLVDFFLMEDRPVAAFDFASEEPGLIDFLPDYTFRADLAGIQGQMDLFDHLIEPDRTAKVVDLAPASFQQFFAVMRQIDFVAGAHRRGIEVVALFITAADSASARGYAGLRNSLPEMLLVPVYNEAVSRQAPRDNFPLSTVSLPLRIPALPAAAAPLSAKPAVLLCGVSRNAAAGHSARYLYAAAPLDAAGVCRVPRTGTAFADGRRARRASARGVVARVRAQ